MVLLILSLFIDNYNLMVNILIIMLIPTILYVYLIYKLKSRVIINFLDNNLHIPNNLINDDNILDLIRALN